MKSQFLFVLRSIVFNFNVSLGWVSAYGLAPITLSVDLRDAPRKLLHPRLAEYTRSACPSRTKSKRAAMDPPDAPTHAGQFAILQPK